MGFDIQSLFGDVAGLTADDRQRHFDKLGVPPDIRDEVASLCRFDAENVSLTDCIAEIASEVLRPDFVLAAGDACGPYKLVRLLGKGGMGTVFLAERADGEVDHRVAIKFIRGASDYPGLRDRFLKERQILASLTHPNIARMLDAGHLHNGQPYLVMEFVDGQPIDAFAAGFPVRQKITLFLKVCSAVAGLHRNLVVHRDLKPANILVTADGEPKLLDFGIAKILGLATDFTLTYQRMLTPDYASPEQVSGGRITTAVDIYSLGVLLYHLLTGKPAHEFDDRSPEAIDRVIASREVTRPSHWAPELKGDLESILLKALRKDPEERYATVEQFADDLQAFLESRPIRARSADWWYRTRKFVRRYWMPMSAAAVVIFSLSTARYLVDRQSAVAEARIGQLRRLSGRLLEIEHQLYGPNAGSDLKLHHDIAAASIQYLESLGHEDLRNQQLALEIGGAYLLIARIQGVPEWNQEGRYSDADRSLSKAEHFADSVLAANPANREALWLSANTGHDRAVIAYTERRPDQVFAYSPKAVEGFDRLARLGSLTRREINGATYIYGDLAEVHIGLHRFEDAVRYARLAIDFSGDNTTVSGPRAQAFNMLAGALTYLGDLQGALQAVNEARNHWDKLRHDEGDNRYTRLILYQTRCREGLLLGEDGGVNLNQPKEATLRLEEAFAALEGDAQRDRNDYEARTVIATSGHYLGDLLRRTNPTRALEVYDRSLVRIREVPSDVAARRIEALLLAGSSYAARAIHRESDAKERIDAAFRLLGESGDYPATMVQPGSEAAMALEALADHYAETGQPNQAIELYERRRKDFELCNSCAERDLPAAVDLWRLQRSLSATLRRVGSTEKAAAVEAARVALWRLWNGKLPGNPFVLRQRG
jgi:tetratricopeptide (TPR) repeat protein/predicted Ser/Thr protein kinase